MRFLLLCLIIWLPLTAHAEISEATAKEKAVTFIGKQVALRLSGWRRVGDLEGKEKKCFHFTNSDEGIDIDVDSTSGLVCRLTCFKGTTVPQKVELTLEQATAVAQDFLENRAKPTTTYLTLRPVTFDDRSNLGLGKIYNFHWVKQIDDVIYPSAVFLSLSASTGEVVDYQWVEHTVNLKSLKPKMSREQAIETVKPMVNLLPGWTVEKIEIMVIPSSPQQLHWHIQARGTVILHDSPEEGKVIAESIADVFIDELGKEMSSTVNQVQPLKTTQLRPPIPTPYGLPTQDYWPSWNLDHKALAVMTFRWVDLGSAAANEQVRREAKEKKQIPYLTVLCLWREGDLRAAMTFQGLMQFPSLYADGNRIAFAYGGEIFVLDLQKGVMGICNDRMRAMRTMPSWHPTESLLAMSGTHSPSDGVGSEDDDIFVAKISKYLGPASMERQWCAAHLPGPDILPVFSPDGKWIVFAHKDKWTEKVPQPNWSLFRVSSDPSSKNVPDKIVELVGEPERLSWMPESKQVLVAYKKPPVASPLAEEKQPKVPFEMIGVDEKTRKTLTFPELHDPDLPNGRPLIMKVATLSPEGQTITFSALRWSGSAQDSGSVCIYTVKLDGSDLKRITSPEDISIPSFVFPQKDINALNAWEKLEPKPNLGRPTPTKATGGEAQNGAK